MKNITTPKFREDFKVVHCEGQGVFLFSETDFSILCGEPFEMVAPHFDGYRTVPEIIDQLNGEVDPEMVYYTVIQLQKKGYIVEATNSEPEDADSAAFWRLCGIGPDQARKALENCTVALRIVGKLPEACSTECLDLLRDSGVSVAQYDKAHDLTLVLTDNYLNPALEEFMNQDQPWLLARPIGRSFWVGPYFVGRSACLHCLQQRLSGHRMIESFLARQKKLLEIPDGAFARTPVSMHIALGSIVQQALRTLVGATLLSDKIISFDLGAFSSREHRLVKRPQCPSCGAADVKSEKKITLHPATRNPAAESGHRAVAPEDTVKRFEHHVSPITGIIRELTPLRNGEDTVKHIYSAGHNFAMMVDDVSFLQATLRMGSGGKGKTDIQAKASAIGEALERYSGLFQGDEARRYSVMDAIGDDAIHPNEMLLFSDHQFAIRDSWNAGHDRYQYVPEKFDTSRPVEWSPLWSLTQDKMRYLPTACCYYGYSHHAIPRKGGIWTGFSNGDSNGCAAGNTIEEAIMQGLFELVERDGVASWWYSRCNRPEVDLDSFKDPYFGQMQEHYKGLGRQLWVLDVTNDIGLPTFVAVSRRLNVEKEEIIWGCGAHIEPRIGILRALTEVNQFLAAFERFSSETDRYLGFDPEAVRWFETATLAQQNYLSPLPTSFNRNCSDYAATPSGDLTDVLRHCISLVEQQGLEVLVLDQTREDVELPVVRVVVPGLRHFFARFAPGRLYDVPKKLNWIDKKLSEPDLNPIPVFF